MRMFVIHYFDTKTSSPIYTCTYTCLFVVPGRNCRFLQGPGTDQAAVDIIRKGITEGRDVSVCLLNYKADGKPFWNQFFLAALRDAEGQIVNYVGVQCEVNITPVHEIKDRIKRLPIPSDL